MQSITRNGLADPGLIGVKEGSCVVVLAPVLLFPSASLVWRPRREMAGGALVATLVMLLARDFSRPRFVLIGIGVSWFFAAGMGVFMTTADVRDVQTALVWLAGAFMPPPPLLLVALVWTLPAAIILFATARASDVALLGNATATGLESIYPDWRCCVFSRRLYSPPPVLPAWQPGFVGLMAPHMARFWLRGGQTALLWEVR